MIANIFKQLGINETLWAQLAIFVVLYVFLRAVFFGPFMRLIELRERETGGTEKDAAEITSRAAAQEAEYQAKISAVKKQSKEAAEKILAQAKNDVGLRVGKARDEAKTKIETGREALRLQAKAEAGEVEGRVDGLAATIVEKLMKAKVEI